MLLARRIFRTSLLACRHYQITVAGGASEVGQTVCLLLRAQTNVANLVVHDFVDYTSGVTVDLSHLPVDSSISGYSGYDNLDTALRKSDIVLAVGGALITPGTNLNQSMSNNINFIKFVAARVARLRPMPFFAVLTEPINSTVPIAAEMMRHNGYCDPKKLFGITTIDALRAQTLYATTYGLEAHKCDVPVIGGHSDSTVVPLLSHAKPEKQISDSEAQTFAAKLRHTNEKIIRAKRGWAPSLSIAYSALLFTQSLLKALEGDTVVVNAFVENNQFGTSYFGGPIEVDKYGAREMTTFGNLSPFECHLLEHSIGQIRNDVLCGKRLLEHD